MSCPHFLWPPPLHGAWTWAEIRLQPAGRLTAEVSSASDSPCDCDAKCSLNTTCPGEASPWQCLPGPRLAGRIGMKGGRFDGG